MKSAIILIGALTLTASAAFAQTSTGTQTSTPRTGDVSAGTYGSGTSTNGGTAVNGGATAEALNGGTATTRSDAQVNERTARQRSVATARDDDERARSRTSTRVTPTGDVRSRSMSIYKQRGEKPVITRDSSKAKAPR